MKKSKVYVNDTTTFKIYLGVKNIKGKKLSYYDIDVTSKEMANLLE